MASRISPLIIVSILLLCIDWYIYKAILSIESKWSKKRINQFTAIWWGYSVLLVSGVFASIYFNLNLTARAIILVAFFITFVTKFFFLPFLFLDDFRRGVIWITRRLFKKDREEKTVFQRSEEHETISRSEFLVKAGIAVASIPFASLTWGIVSGAYDYQVKRQTLFLKDLPRAFEGIKLAQISDIHSGSFYNQTAVRGGVEMLLAEKPDVVFFTGDLVNNVASEMQHYQDIFSKVKAPLGVYSCLGNHDYGNYKFGQGPSAAKAKNLSEVIATHKNMGWQLLMNENRILRVDQAELAIVGVENWGTGRFPKYGKLDLAVKGLEKLPVKLLLSHDPSHWKAQVLSDHPEISAMFSGHTHGMQFGVKTDDFKWSPVQYVYDEWAGLYQQDGQQLYVNTGYGFLGYPGRVGILPEITIFELKGA